MGEKVKRKRVMLTIDRELFGVIKNLEGHGDKMAEKCLNMIRCYLSEHRFLDGEKVEHT